MNINPHPIPSPLQKFHLEEVVNLATSCYARGWNAGTSGNFSVRGSSGILWQSPSGIPKGKLDPSSFIPVDSSTLAAIPPISSRPSAETPLHAAVYRNYLEANVVLHVHPPYVVSATQGAHYLEFSGQEMSKAFGVKTHEGVFRIRVYENSQDMVKIGRDFDSIRPTFPLFIMRGHGVYSWGKGGYSALAVLEALEFLCQTIYQK